MRTVKFVFLPLLLAVVFPTIGWAQTRISPAAAVRNYVNALVTDNFVGFWVHSAACNTDVWAATKNLPTFMQQEKAEVIRRSWEQRIRKERSRPVDTGNACWTVFRPGAKLEFLETRAWQSFVRVSYADVPEAPTIFTGQGQGELGRLKSAIVIVNVKENTFLVSDLDEVCLEMRNQGFSWYELPWSERNLFRLPPERR
jgi:hypothetical protein